MRRDAPSSGAQLETGRKASILIVDDDPNKLAAIEALLAPLNQVLVRANSGGEALQRVLRDDYALILLDVKMPDMDGL